MIKTVYIDSMDALSRFIMDQQRNPEYHRLRSPYYYRGLPDVSYRLYTSLSRNCGEKQRQLEPIILDSFTKYALIEDPTLRESVWRQMILGQQHGLPTRLLDWTHSPMVALHFATSEHDLEQLDQHDCVVWRIDAVDVNRNLPDKYRQMLKNGGTQKFSIDMLTRIAPDMTVYDSDLGGSAFAMLEPPSIDQRIINQYAFFSVIPTDMNDIEGFLEAHTEKTVRYIIRKELRWDIRDILDQFNMNERTVYPGLDGLSKWIGRHYYVRPVAGETTGD